MLDSIAERSYINAREASSWVWHGYLYMYIYVCCFKYREVIMIWSSWRIPTTHKGFQYSILYMSKFITDIYIYIYILLGIGGLCRRLPWPSIVFDAGVAWSLVAYVSLLTVVCWFLYVGCYRFLYLAVVLVVCRSFCLATVWLSFGGLYSFWLFVLEG